MDPSTKPLVRVVDDDECFRDSMLWLMRSAEIEVAGFGDAAEFLAGYDADRPGCLLLDLRMPGLGGLDVQQILGDRQRFTPIIFVTAHGDVAVAVRAIRDGAFDFLQKPVEHRLLFQRVTQALAASITAVAAERTRRQLQAAVTSLSLGERRVWALAAMGLRDKAIAERLGLSVRTVEVRKRNARAKLGVRSGADLARLSVLAGALEDAEPPPVENVSAARGPEPRPG